MVRAAGVLVLPLLAVACGGGAGAHGIPSAAPERSNDATTAYCVESAGGSTTVTRTEAGEAVISHSDEPCPSEPAVSVGRSTELRDAREARANVRTAIPALEAYYTEHQTYAGASLEQLRTTYDPALHDVQIVGGSAQTYCVQSTVGAATVSKPGPVADLRESPCA